MRRTRSTTFDTRVTKDSVLLSFLVNLLPIAVLVILLLLFMSQMQGGGSRVLNFGKSKAKLVAKDTPKTTFADVAGRRRGGRGAARDQGLPAEPGQVPGPRRQDPEGRAAVRPARYR